MSTDKKPRQHSYHRKHRHKRSYTFMIISGDSDGVTKRLHLNHSQTQWLAYSLFALALFLGCYIIYSMMTISNLRSIEAKQQKEIAELTEENSTLAASNEVLSANTEHMTAALNEKLETEHQSAEEAEKLAIPSGFPLTGTTPLPAKAVDDPNSTEITKLTDKNKNTAKGNPLVLFTASQGSNIVATGSGTVMAVTSDAKFGNVVSIDHGNGYISIYRNSGSAVVSEGSTVDKGDVLFIVNAKNTLLGYQIQKDEKYVDPEEVMDIKG